MGKKGAFWLAVVSIILALGSIAWVSYQLRHECAKQCDWGDTRCQKMCKARHFCPAHPDGE